MISQQQLSRYIESHTPGISSKLKSDCRNIYDTVRRFFEYTRELIADHKLSDAQACLAVAEQLYTNGDAPVKNAIENVYVYSFSRGFFCDSNNREQLMTILPLTLYSLYKKQLLNHL